MAMMGKAMKAKAMERKMKGQVALEALIVISFVLLLMTPLLYTLYKRALDVQEELRTLEAVRAVDTLAAVVSMVGMTGPNSSATLSLSLPDSVRNLTIGKINDATSAREIFITVETSLGTVDIVRIVPFNTRGQITLRKGEQTLKVVYPESGLPIVVNP